MTSKSRIIYILYLITISASCQSDSHKNNLDYKFDTSELRNAFLEDIYSLDQSSRTQFASADFNNEEKHKFWKAARKIDSLNLIKIDQYLHQFGYPDTINYTTKARKSPWYVIQHCTTLDKRTKYYKLLKQAYKTEKINDIDFYLYLQRNYQFKNREMLGIENDDNYSFNEKIMILIDTLGYEW